MAENTSATSFKPDLEQYYKIHERLDDPKIIRLLHGVFGLCTETGELQDQLKRHLFYGKELDLVNIVEEIGDLLWYIAEVLNATDTSLLEAMVKNIDKLRKRFPDNFTEHAAINRDVDGEREVLETKPPAEWGWEEWTSFVTGEGCCTQQGK